MEKFKNKNSNGITLIALIITIIVMLILVGVTITVALNGGLFNTAKSAATNTMVEAEREQLLSAVATAYDTETGTINKSKLESNLGTGWNVVGNEGGPYTVTSPKGNEFTVNANGAIDYTGKEDESVAGKNLGKYVTYQGISWIVLYDDADKVELISAEALGEVTLGYEDAGAKTNVTVTDGEEQFKRGAWSYNNVITTLTEACKAETGISANIRNVGGPAEETTTANVTFEEVKSGENGFTPRTDLDEETLTKLKTNIESVKQGDENYKNDYDQMKALGIIVTDTPKDYWLASRFVDVDSSGVDFSTRYINDGGDLYGCLLCDVNYDGYAYGDTYSRAVRPVVSLSSGILGGKTGEGTRANPINLD